MGVVLIAWILGLELGSHLSFLTLGSLFDDTPTGLLKSKGTVHIL